MTKMEIIAEHQDRETVMAEILKILDRSPLDDDELTKLLDERGLLPLSDEEWGEILDHYPLCDDISEQMEWLTRLK